MRRVTRQARASRWCSPTATGGCSPTRRSWRITAWCRCAARGEGRTRAWRHPDWQAECLRHSLPAECYLPRCLQVRRASEHQKYVAQVVCVGYDVDIAVLNVEDEQFWRSMPLLPLPHGLPAAMSEVLTAGFPTGGEELATTRGECA